MSDENKQECVSIKIVSTKTVCSHEEAVRLTKEIEMMGLGLTLDYGFSVTMEFNVTPLSGG